MLRGGGVVALEAGRTYRVGKPLNVGPDTQIKGEGATLLTDHPLRFVIQIRGDNVEIRDLKIHSTASFDRSRVAIMVARGASGLRLFGNQVSGFFGTAVMISGGGQRAIHIQGNRIDPAGGKIGYGVLVTAVALGPSVSYPRDIDISSNTIVNVSADAIEINSPIGERRGYPATASNIIINDNVLSAPNSDNRVGFCIGLAGVYSVNIVENKMSNCRWQGIHIEDKSSKINIINNNINTVIGPEAGQSQWGRNSSGILVLNSSDVKILGNTISGARHNGIDIGYNPKGLNREIIVAGNLVLNPGRVGVVFSGPKVDIKSVIGGFGDYSENVIEGAGEADFVGCVSLSGSQSSMMRCDH